MKNIVKALFGMLMLVGCSSETVGFTSGSGGDVECVSCNDGLYGLGSQEGTDNQPWCEGSFEIFQQIMTDVCFAPKVDCAKVTDTGVGPCFGFCDNFILVDKCVECIQVENKELLQKTLTCMSDDE